MGTFTVTFRGRFRVVPEGKSEAETFAALDAAFAEVGSSRALKEPGVVVSVIKSRGFVEFMRGLKVRYSSEPFNPVTEVTEVKTIN